MIEGPRQAPDEPESPYPRVGAKAAEAWQDERVTTVRRNRWTEVLDRRASTLSAAGMFGLHVLGQLALIVSSIAAMGGMLLVFGALGSGIGGRLIGGAMLAGAAVGFYLGAWASREYGVQRRS